MRKLIGLLLLSFCLGIGAVGQVGSHLKEEFQDPEKHGLRVVERVAEIRAALLDPAVRLLCLQTFGEELPSETQRELLEWVRSGKTVWFYDARLASQFGMQPYLLDTEQFRHKPEKGVLGGSKHAGLATVAVSFGQHAVQTGVGQATVFLPEMQGADEEEKLYGAVQVAEDTVPLLQFALDSPALMALRRDGRGLIVYKTLLWNESLSGDRFQLNLLDFSAGYPVPGPAGQGKVGSPPGPEAEYIVGNPASPLEPGTASAPSSAPSTHPGEGQVASIPAPAAGGWSLELRDGTRLLGELQGEMLQFETGTGSLKLRPEEILSLEFGDSIKLDKLITSKGKTESGLFLSSPLKFRTERGVEEFEKEDVQLLQREADAPDGEKR